MQDWTQFTKRVTVEAPAKTIYRAWMTKDGIESWFLRSAQTADSNGSLRPRDSLAESGNAFLWSWHGWGEEADLRGEFKFANGCNEFQFTFHEPMLVTVRILQEFGISIVELQQQNIPQNPDAVANFFVGCGEGWTFYLANLKSVLEGGLDLRNKNPAIKQVINS